MGSELTLTHPHITLRRRGAAIRLASRAAYVKSEATRRADRLTDLEAPRLCPQSARLLHRHDNSTWVHELLKKPVMGLQQHTHNSTTMAQTAYEFDHETTKGFSLLTSLRQHFAALRQQNADVLAPQPKTTLDDLCAPYWVQPYDLQHNDHKIAVLGCQALASSRPQCSNVQPAKPTKQPMRSPVFLCNSKVRRHKQRQHHRRHQQQEKHHEHVLHNNHPISHLLAEDPQGAQHVQLEPACSSAPQEAVSYEAAATEALGQALRVHHLKDGSTPSIGHTSSINQRCSLQQLHNSTPSSPYPGAVAIETYTTQTLAHDSHVGCIRAQPRLMWQDSLKPTDSIPDRIDLCLRLNQGRPSAHTFQIAADLSKAGQLRTQNLHAAVRASLQLMHRFVVRPSAIAHMGVFTTDKREQQYTQQGLGLYFFALDEDYYIDATYKGNIARYINHSCRPNCVAKLVDVQGQHRVFIFATQEIAPLEELTYDYKVSGSETQHDASTKAQSIPCKCNSLLCRGNL